MPGMLLRYRRTYPLVKETPSLYILLAAGQQFRISYYHFQSGLRSRSRTENLSCLLRTGIRTPNTDPDPGVKITQFCKNINANIFKSVLFQFFETDPKLSRKAEYGPDPNIMNWYGLNFFFIRSGQSLELGFCTWIQGLGLPGGH
jgi:hypothetical protein